MKLSKHKLEAIIAALKLARDACVNDRQYVIEALHWAQEQSRNRANGKRSYLGAKAKERAE